MKKFIIVFVTVVYSCFLTSCGDDSVSNSEITKSRENFNGNWIMRSNGYSDQHVKISTTENSLSVDYFRYSGSFKSNSFTGYRVYTGGSLKDDIVLNFVNDTIFGSFNSFTFQNGQYIFTHSGSSVYTRDINYDN